MINIFYFLGIVGLLLIILGILIKPRNRNVRDILYIIGGLFLLGYSLFIRDYIFIVLQVVFVIVAIVDLVRLKK
ncbi:hypothetical protein CMI42_06595 [Candidatus Pacearchaeota archaeon]|nr:hypothetical protein [Candidatus Pacearchaeota archaeon]